MRRCFSCGRNTLFKAKKAAAKLSARSDAVCSATDEPGLVFIALSLWDSNWDEYKVEPRRGKGRAAADTCREGTASGSADSRLPRGAVAFVSPRSPANI